ncbi:hypothetical protein FSARC_14304, partial [Fusarium sarcochroum]
MTNEERESSRLAGLDSYGRQYFKNWALNVERSRLEAEIAHINYVLVAHRDCCGASQVCTHSIHLGPPQKTPTCNIAQNRTMPKVTDSTDVSVFLLYDPSCSWQFRTVPGAIRRIVMNLFGNSLKYTARGVIKVSIDQSRCEHRESRNHVITLTVEDTGSGISEEFLRNNIFKPFSQEDHLSTGTGLGLSVVKRITSQLGGSVSITSQVEVGTKVTVSLPMMSETILPVSELSADKPDKEQTTCYGLRAQVVSSTERLGPDPDYKELTADALMEKLCCDYLGMKLSMKSDAAQLAPDVIILTDDAMSKSSGSAVLWQEMPILVVCANALVVHQHESRPTTDQPRLYEFVSQPLSPYKIERALSRVLSLWAESQAGLQAPMPTISTVISHSQSPTPTPVASESPAGALVPTQDYFPMRQFLLVDDNPINLKILICFMKKLKQSYETASNGEEAVMTYKADPGR